MLTTAGFVEVPPPVDSRPNDDLMSVVTVGG
jgi:hypothetical protein